MKQFTVRLDDNIAIMLDRMAFVRGVSKNRIIAGDIYSFYTGSYGYDLKPLFIQQVYKEQPKKKADIREMAAALEYDIEKAETAEEKTKLKETWQPLIDQAETYYNEHWKAKEETELKEFYSWYEKKLKEDPEFAKQMEEETKYSI